MPVEQSNIERFRVFRAKTPEALVEILNVEAHPYARVIQFGMVVNEHLDAEWTAVLDMALQLVLTVDDVEHMQFLADQEAESEHEDTSSEVLPKTKLNMAA